MAVTIQPLKFLRFRRPLFTLSRQILVKFHYCVHADGFKAVKCRDEDCDDFLPWLERKAGMEISSVLSIGLSKYGRSLFASKNIEAGDCLLKVPFKVQISPDNMLPEIKSLIGDEVGFTAKLAVVILHEQMKGQDSEWAPYISRLPRPRDMHSTVWIQVDIPYHDHLRELKLNLLQRYWLQKIKDASFSSSGGSFLIKKVRSSRGKGKGIPQSLRAFARVMSCTSSQELNDLAMEASRNDGRLARYPLTNRHKELHAHQLLLSLFDGLIEKYDSSIKSLHSLKSSTSSSSFMLRRQMARDLLGGEVDVLRSASSWLKNYCFSCQQQTLIL